MAPRRGLKARRSSDIPKPPPVEPKPIALSSGNAVLEPDTECKLLLCPENYTIAKIMLHIAAAEAFDYEQLTLGVVGKGKRNYIDITVKSGENDIPVCDLECKLGQSIVVSMPIAASISYTISLRR